MNAMVGSTKMFAIDPISGLVSGARQLSSPNCDDRPTGSQPELIVVHCISLPPGEFGGPWIDRFFTNRLDPNAHPYFQEIAELRVSAHLLIRRDGELVQYVPLTRRAWHAGPSCFDGRECCNDFSVGIELEGEDDVPYAAIQYERLAELVRKLRQTFRALREAPIVGHSDIAPERKTDPGPAFDWNRLESLLSVVA
jgi:AmpD protein